MSTFQINTVAIICANKIQLRKHFIASFMNFGEYVPKKIN